MTELEALRRVADAARVLATRNLGRVVLGWQELDAALRALDALPTPTAPTTPARSRLAALEALHAVVWDYDRGTGKDLRWSDVRAAIAAVEDSPASAAEPEGEVVEVRAVVFANAAGAWTVYGNHCDEDEQLRDECKRLAWDDEVLTATIRARVPLPRVPEVVGEVG